MILLDSRISLALLLSAFSVFDISEAPQSCYINVDPNGAPSDNPRVTKEVCHYCRREKSGNQILFKCVRYGSSKDWMECSKASGSILGVNQHCSNMDGKSRCCCQERAMCNVNAKGGPAIPTYSQLKTPDGRTYEEIFGRQEDIPQILEDSPQIRDKEIQVGGTIRIHPSIILGLGGSLALSRNLFL